MDSDHVVPAASAPGDVAGTGDCGDRRASARWTVLSRLVSALVREGWLDPAEAARRGVVLPTGIVTETGRRELRAPVSAPSWDGGARGDPHDPAEFLDVLRRAGLLEGDPDAWLRLRADVADSASGLARARRACEGRAGRVRAVVGERSNVRTRPFTELVCALRVAEGADDPLLTAFEQWVVDGHPLQPVAKIKTGMSPGDARRYAPEFGAEFDLRLVAVPRRLVSGATATGERDPAEALRAELRRTVPATADSAESELVRRGLAPGEHALIPVHPHQLRHALPRLHGAALSSGAVTVLSATAPARPLMSTRTLDVRERGERAGVHVKTALEVRLTGAVRGVSAEAVHNGPRISGLLDELAAADPALAPPDRLGGSGFAVCRELVGMRHDPRLIGESAADSPERSRARNRSLGAILREDPAESTNPGEVALPVAALSARSPLTGHPLIHDVLTERRAVDGAGGGGRPSRCEVARRWLGAHLDLGLSPLLTLLVRYGIALEPHPQNTVLVLRSGRPRSWLVRDLGGARVLGERLRRSGRRPRLLEGTGVCCHDPEALRNKLFFPLFVNHLGELVAALAVAAGCPERVLWRVVAERVRSCFAGLVAAAGSPEEAAAARADAAALLHEPWPLKTMLTMRLSGLVTEQRYVPAPNPLARS
ncbi:MULTISPECIES: IucA/IucC family siderophore biosynthesis protein [unclassified Actinopolyspora]|uniref:IucA/IucC family protein n=1 Tax=unclassified Actinopolyspora TaxID=2639451 RepID=UPI0013F5C0C4|nr:IucA/IucC family siderophore biosynthesis protein [Actinopolyspora sp. BKK2]NHE77178.1 IucA/IucC family siderophore biosynthesis protein [Actinopolyspora sp. BKK1]